MQLEAPAADHEPAAHAVQLGAPAADHEPAAQLAQSVSVINEHAAGALPAPQVSASAGVQAAHGARPVAENVLPATHARRMLMVTLAAEESELPAPELVACTTSA